MRLRINSKGFVLIFSLWVLAVLVLLATSVAAGIRQKIILAKKLDETARMNYLLDAALVQSKAYVRTQLDLTQYAYTLTLKNHLYNNPGVFNRIALGNDNAEVVVVDEERKININTTNAFILQRLLGSVLGVKPDEAARLAESILDWRQEGESQITGFYSDEYYSNLQYPYKKKNAPYEVPDELLLVKGVTKEIYERILPFVTIYGEGKVNVNTAPAPVLYALGLDESLVEKILMLRQGRDGQDNTEDDFIFTKTFDVAAEVNASTPLLPQEARAVDALNIQGLLTVNSYFFSIDITGFLDHSVMTKHARAIFDARENKTFYWREK